VEALYAIWVRITKDIVTTGITKRVVVDVDMDRWDVGLGINLADTTCFLMKIIERKAIWWYDTISISIIVVLITV
jgi:hypothetical protein